MTPPNVPRGRAQQGSGVNVAIQVQLSSGDTCCRLHLTCSYTSIAQVWRDRDPPPFVDTHALYATVHPCDEFAQAHLTDEVSASVVTGKQRGQVMAEATITSATDVTFLPMKFIYHRNYQ